MMKTKKTMNYKDQQTIENPTATNEESADGFGKDSKNNASGNSRDPREAKDLKEGFAVNSKIRVRELRVIDAQGENLGVIEFEKALNLAQQSQLDLVQIGRDTTGVVIAKIMDFGKFLYERKKQQGEAKKNQKVIELKEVRMRPNIDIGDYGLKLDKIAEFIADDMHVKMTLQFRGRENATKEQVGPKMFERIVGDLKERLPSYTIDFQKESKGGSAWTRVVAGRKTGK